MIPISFLLFFILSLFSCKGDTPKPQNSTFSVITFNMQTFFDDLDDGDEYTDYLRKNGWDKSAYDKRIECTERLLREEAFSSADVIFFQEIESERVLRDLLSGGLSRRGFIYYGVAESEGPISVGYISKLKAIDFSFHYTDGQRCIMKLDFLKDNTQFRCYTLHAKSNIGTDGENKAARVAMARHINELLERDRSIPSIVLGDFNTGLSATIDDMLVSASYNSIAEIRESGALAVSELLPLRDDRLLYDPLYDDNQMFYSDGTYYYQGKWYVYDHILMNYSLCSLAQSALVSILSEYTSASDGLPFAFNKEKGSGFSDHFAVKLDIIY